MGQFALGLKNLALKLAVFVVLAALLAWALGGTLWPRPHIADMDANAARLADWRYYWRVELEDRRQDQPQYQLMVAVEGRPTRAAENRVWSNFAGPVTAQEFVYYGGCDDHSQWFLVRLDSAGLTTDHPMPDRLAVEQQMARVAAGLPIQDEATIRSQRPIVLEPSSSETPMTE